MRYWLTLLFFFIHCQAYAGDDYKQLEDPDETIIDEATTREPIDPHAKEAIRKTLTDAFNARKGLGLSYKWYMNDDGTLTFRYPNFKRHYFTRQGSQDHLCQYVLNSPRAFTPKPEKVEATVYDAATYMVIIGETFDQMKAVQRGNNGNLLAIVSRFDCRISGLGTPISSRYRTKETLWRGPGQEEIVLIRAPAFSWHQTTFTISADSDLSGVCKLYGYTTYSNAQPTKSLNPFAKSVKLDVNGRYVKKQGRAYGYLESIQCRN